MWKFLILRQHEVLAKLDAKDNSGLSAVAAFKNLWDVSIANLEVRKRQCLSGRNINDLL